MRIPDATIQMIKPPHSAGRTDPAGNFGDSIKQAINNVNESQQTADKLATKLAVGDAVEVHQAMIAMQKASTAFQFTVQVRNKILEAYQEIMRMQV